MKYKPTIQAIAIREIGYHEIPQNKVKYWDINPKYQGQAWCMAFIAWCIREDDNLNPLLKIMETCKYNCGELLKWVNLEASIYTKAIERYALPGMLALYDSDGNGRSEHVGIINTRIDNNRVSTIEGNLDNAVKITIRNVSEIIAVYPCTEYVKHIISLTEDEIIDTPEYWLDCEVIPEYLDVLIDRLYIGI
jgi:hypothetical protein